MLAGAVCTLFILEGNSTGIALQIFILYKMYILQVYMFFQLTCRITITTAQYTCEKIHREKTGETWMHLFQRTSHLSSMALGMKMLLCLSVGPSLWSGIFQHLPLAPP